MNIMIVEDTSDMQLLAQEAVRRRFPEARIDIYGDGNEAMLGTREWDIYDLVITDKQMPEMNGMRLGMEIRALGYKGRVALWTGSCVTENTENFNHVVSKDCLGDFLDALKEGDYDE